MLREIAASVEAARFEVNGEKKIELPVKLKVHDWYSCRSPSGPCSSPATYRCVLPVACAPSRRVPADVEASRTIYNWVVELCVSLGANRDEMAPFEKYANAAKSLGSPSSAARRRCGAQNIERVDRLVQSVAAQKGMRLAR